MDSVDYKFIVDQVSLSIAEHELIYDEFNNPVDYKFVFVNQPFLDSLNMKREDVIGNTVMNLIPTTEKYWLDTYAEVVETGIPKDFVNYAKKFNTYFSVQAFKSRENHFVTVFKDVTSFINDEIQLENSSKLLRTFSQSSKAAFFDFDVKKGQFNYSDNLEEIIGRENITLDNYLNNFVNLVHSDDVRKVVKLNNQFLKGKIEEIHVELRFYNQMKKDYIWMDFYAYVTEKKKFLPMNIKGIIRDITTEKKFQIDFEETQSIFQNTRSIANIVTFLYYPHIKSFDESEELLNFLGVEELETIDQFRKIVHPEDLGKFDQNTDYMMNNESGTNMWRIIKNGEVRHIKSYLYSSTKQEGDTIKISGILQDVTQEEKNRLVLENSQRSFSQIFQTSPAGIIILDEDFNITMKNQRFLNLVDNSDITLREFLDEDYHTIIDAINHGDEINDHEIVYYLDNETKHYSLTISHMIGLDNKYQINVMDVTDKVEQQDKINFLATRDILTKVYNRNYFEDYTGKLTDETVGFMICDIDGLKLINDAFSHLEGDKLLVQFAAHLNKTFSDDLVARLGGDEFCILTYDKTVDELEEYEQKIKKYMNDLYMFGISIDVSIGYALKQPNEDFYQAFIQAENIMYRRKLTERSSRKSNALNTIMQTLHEKTHETREHCDRVGEYAVELLKRFGRKRQYELEEIKLVSDVHDIGKIAISDAILSKPGKLTDEEYNIIKGHSESGYKIVTNIMANDDIAVAVLYHHERWDGLGYPHNLEKEQIPLYARIISIADAYDTMISGRVYQKGVSKEDAIKELERCSGTQFDPYLVSLFIEYLKEN